MGSLKQLIQEIHRRSLWQVLGIYLAGSWVAYEVAQGLTEGLGLPTWLPGVALVLLIIGLPIVLATAFVQEGGPIGSDDEDPTERWTKGTSSRILTWRNAILGGMAAFALLGFVGSGWMILNLNGEVRGLLGFGPEAGPSIEQSVAVLPFDNLSGDPDQQYFSDGVSDQILNALTRIPDLKVTARTSAFAFRDTDLDIRTIADSLGVATVVEGSVQRSGDLVRIRAQLIEANSGFNLWSESYERQLTDIFAIQDEVARRIAERLRVELRGVEGARLVGPVTQEPEAHDYYLRGRELLYQRSPGGIRAAIDAFSHSIEVDPEYAPAYVGLGQAYTFAVPYSAAPPDSTFIWAGRALAFTDRAIALDSTSGEAFATRALARVYFAQTLDEALARNGRDYRRALELQPNSADILGWYAQHLHISEPRRHDEAWRLQERSLSLDPVSPGRRMGYAGSARFVGEHELELAQVRQARSLQPGLGGLASVLEAESLLLLGRTDECLSLDPLLPAYEAMCLYSSGRVRDAEARIDSLAAAWNLSSPWLVADGLVSYYAWTGQVGEALQWVERGLEASPFLNAAYLAPPGIWEPVLDRDERRVRESIDRLNREAWERVLAEKRRVELP